MPEITSAQVLGIPDTQLANPLPASYATYRTIRKHPTIALARALRTAPVVSAEWSVEADDGVPEDRIDFIERVFFPIREPLVSTAMEGGIDFGWQPYELIFVSDDPRFPGQVVVKDFKPLLHDITTILVVPRIGTFNGFEQSQTQTIVPVEQCLLIPFRQEGGNLYGQSLLENARADYNRWVKAQEGASRYDEKMAGSHFVIKYPAGKAIFNGTETDNSEIAKSLLKLLTSAGSLTIPKTLVPYSELTNRPEISDVTAWEIDVVGDSVPKQYSFIPRLEYLDVLMVRALLLPERSVLKGSSGTNAEAETHGKAAVTYMDLEHRHITRLLNWHVVDRLLALNYGEETRGTVRLVASPIADEKADILIKVYERLLANPQSLIEEMLTLDTEALKDSLGIPRRDPEEGEALRVRMAGMQIPDDDDAIDADDVAAEDSETA